MDSGTIVSIMLGILAAAVGWAGYAGGTRANKINAVGIPADVEADAYERARVIYEGAIDQLKEQMGRFRDEVQALNVEVSMLRRSNAELLAQVDDLKTHNRQLTVQIVETREVNTQLMTELERVREQ